MNHQTLATLVARLRNRAGIHKAKSSAVIKAVSAAMALSALIFLGFDAFTLKEQLAKNLIPAPAADPSQPVTPPALSLSEISGLELMGSPVIHTASTTLAPTPAPNMDIRLVGTITDSVPRLASALISVGGQPSKRVFVGEAFAEGITLQAVFDDRVQYSYADTTLDLHFPFTAERNIPQIQNRQRRQAELQHSVVPSSASDEGTNAEDARNALKRFKALKRQQ